MKKVILDTSFIMTCIRQKIDFFEKLEQEGLKILIPKQVIREIQAIINSKKKLHFREDAKLGLEILNNNKYKEIDLKTRKVDYGIRNFLEKNKNIILASLDKELKKKTKNQKIVIRGKKNLEII